jgi:hypothetical protein
MRRLGSIVIGPIHLYASVLKSYIRKLHDKVQGEGRVRSLDRALELKAVCTAYEIKTHNFQDTET